MMLILKSLLLGVIALGIAIYIQHRVSGVGTDEKPKDASTKEKGGKTIGIDTYTYKRVGLVLLLWIVFNGLLWMILPAVMQWWQGRGVSFFLGTEIAIMILLYLMVSFKNIQDEDKPGIKTIQKAIFGLLMIGLLIPPFLNWWNEEDDPPPPMQISATTPEKSGITTLSGAPISKMLKGIGNIGESMLDFVGGGTDAAKKSTLANIRVEKRRAVLEAGSYLLIPIEGLKDLVIRPKGGCVHVVRPDSLEYDDCPGIVVTMKKLLNVTGNIKIYSKENYDMVINLEFIR